MRHASLGHETGHSKKMRPGTCRASMNVLLASLILCPNITVSVEKMAKLRIKAGLDERMKLQHVDQKCDIRSVSMSERQLGRL